MQFLPILPNFARDAQCYANNFFGFPHWYEYLDVNIDATTKVCQVSKFTFPGDITLVVLALLDMGLRLAGLVALGFIVYGAINYVTSQGEPDKTKKAQETVLNALIGLTIALLAAGIVRFIGARIGV
jgi:hypothetical protein